MGLGGFTSGGNATFLNIGMGVDEKQRPRAIIGRRANQGDPGAVQVFVKKDEPAVDKDGKPVYRTEYLYVEGVVTSIERGQVVYNGKNIDKLVIHINDGGQAYALQLEKPKDYWIDFALRCDDIDWSKPVRFTPYSIPDEKDPKFSNRHLVPSQAGQKIMKKYKIQWLRQEPTEVDPNSPPPFIHDVDEGVWRKGKTLRWLEEGPIQRAIDKVAFLNNIPAHEEERPIENQAQVYGNGAPAPVDNTFDGAAMEDDSDLPF